MDSNYAENWHDVIELCLQHVSNLRYEVFSPSQLTLSSISNTLVIT